MTREDDFVRVAIVEDHALVRQSMIELVEKSDRFRVVAEAGDAEQAIPLLRGTEPDIVLVDIALPGRSGIELAEHIHDELPGTEVLFVSMHDDDLTLQSAMDVDPAGFVSKVATGDELLEALETVSAGASYISPEVAGKVIDLASGRGRTPATELTDREVEVLRLLATGKRHEEIAEELFVSLKTVKNHLTSIYTKLDVDRASQAVAEAYQQGIIRPDEDL